MLVATAATADPGDVLWANHYDSNAGFDSMDITLSGGYICVGSVLSSPTDADILIIETDADGNELWSVTYGGDQEDEPESVIALADGGFLICGQTESFTADLQDAFLWKIDASGGVVWEQFFDGPGYTTFSSVIQNADGDFVCAGYTQTLNGDYEGLVAKYAPDGTLISSGHINSPDDDLFTQIIQNADGSYVACGYTDPGGTEGYWLVKLDSEFGIVWRNSYMESVRSRAQCIASADGGYVLGGFLGNFGDAKARLLRLDQDGNVIWENHYGGDFWNSCNDMIALADGGFAVAGFYSLVSSTWHPWVFTIDAGGVLGWEQIYAEQTGGTAISLAQDENENVLACGQIRIGWGSYAFLMKIENSSTVAMFMPDFDLHAEGSAVSLTFQINQHAALSDFELVGSNGLTEWTVELSFDGSNYSAQDQNTNLNAGGTFTYNLYYYGNDERTLLQSQDVQVAPMVMATKLTSIYPNPFNPMTKINFTLATGQNMGLDIVDVRGRQVRTLLSETMAAGEHSVNWNGLNDNGRAMPSGTYFAIMKSEAGQSMQRLTLVR